MAQLELSLELSLELAEDLHGKSIASLQLLQFPFRKNPAKSCKELQRAAKKHVWLCTKSLRVAAAVSV
jgi:hypothetical protein